MMRVTMYSRPDCPPCDGARMELAALRSEYPHELIEVDVSKEPSLAGRYGDELPVVEVGPYRLKSPFTPIELRVTLAAARDGLKGKEKREPVNPGTAMRLNRGLRFFARHWLAVFNLAVFVYVGLPFVAPALMKIGAERQARWIYTAYSPLCHQLAFRSWFLFGDQIAYPRALAGTGLPSFGEVTGLDEGDLFGARAFVGNEQIGYKVAFCERDVAIYAGIFLGGIAFSFLRHRLRPLPIPFWLLVGIAPIALDGGTQLISEMNLPFIPFGPRESTPLLRTLTGLLFGLMNVWLAYPYLEESMAETRALIGAKLDAARKRGQSPSTAA